VSAGDGPRALRGAMLATLLAVATAHVLRASHSAPSLRAPNASLAQTRAKGATRYVLAHYSNQFCGGAENIARCQELFNDGNCHMSGEYYVKMEDHGGTFMVHPGTDSECSCHNGDVLSKSYSANECDMGDGVTLLVGESCGYDEPYCNKAFDEMLAHCPANAIGEYDADVAGAGSCSLSFGLVKAGASQHGTAKAIPGGGPVSAWSSAVPNKPPSMHAGAYSLAALATLVLAA